MTIASMFEADTTALIGRDPLGLAEDYAHEDDETCALLVAEHRAMEDMIELRSVHLVPTPSRQTAIALIPAIATLCTSMKAVDLLLITVRDWLDDMGDVRRQARQVTSDRAQGIAREDVRLEVPMAFNARAVFDIHSAEVLSVTLEVHRRRPVIVGIYNIDTDDGDRARAPVPELVA
jgi:hypothetical protein